MLRRRYFMVKNVRLFITSIILSSFSFLSSDDKVGFVATNEDVDFYQSLASDDPRWLNQQIFSETLAYDSQQEFSKRSYTIDDEWQMDRSKGKCDKEKHDKDKHDKDKHDKEKHCDKEKHDKEKHCDKEEHHDKCDKEEHEHHDKCDKEKHDRDHDKIEFDVRNKDIGFHCNPTPEHHCCLMPQVYPGYSTTLYYNSAVEPAVAVNPKNKSHAVAAWQQGRFSDRGSLEIGIAYTHDGGKCWKHTVVPFQDCQRGFSQRVSNCWLSYSHNGDCLYLSALVFNASTDINTQNQEGVVVAVSHDDGKHWSIPHYLAATSNSFQSGTPTLQKPSVTADCRCHRDHRAYVVWDQFIGACPFSTMPRHSSTYISITDNCGKCWSPNMLLYDPYPDLFNTKLSNGVSNDAQTTNNIIVCLPNDDLLNFMTRIYAKPQATNTQFVNDVWPWQYTLFDIAFVRSTDHGKTWETAATIVTSMDANEVWTCGYNYNSSGQIVSGNGVLCRTEVPLFSVAVNPHNGTIYVVWQTSQFGTPNNLLPQIALTRSRDGGTTWSAPIKVNKTTAESDAPNPQAFTPSVAVNKEGHVGLMYHDFRKNDSSCTPETKTNTWFAQYIETPYANGGNTGVGLNFKHEKRLSEHSYLIENGPETNEGVMTNGDYERLVVLEDDFHCLYIQSHHGPFEPSETVIDGPSGTLIVDKNKRTSPFFSKLDA